MNAQLSRTFHVVDIEVSMRQEAIHNCLEGRFPIKLIAANVASLQCFSQGLTLGGKFAPEPLLEPNTCVVLASSSSCSIPHLRR
jgi:hypothetical protein